VGNTGLPLPGLNFCLMKGIEIRQRNSGLLKNICTVKQHLSEFLFLRLTKHSEKFTTGFEGHRMSMKMAPGEKDNLYS
jgi:hypothetical protein